jgi:hypothetical protein
MSNEEDVDIVKKGVWIVETLQRVECAGRERARKQTNRYKQRSSSQANSLTTYFVQIQTLHTRSYIIHTQRINIKFITLTTHSMPIQSSYPHTRTHPELIWIVVNQESSPLSHTQTDPDPGPDTNTDTDTDNIPGGLLLGLGSRGRRHSYKCQLKEIAQRSALSSIHLIN